MKLKYTRRKWHSNCKRCSETMHPVKSTHKVGGIRKEMFKKQKSFKSNKKKFYREVERSIKPNRKEIVIKWRSERLLE